MGEQHRRRTFVQHRARYATEDEFAKAAMAIAAHDQQVRFKLSKRIHDRILRRAVRGSRHRRLDGHVVSGEVTKQAPEPDRTLAFCLGPGIDDQQTHSLGPLQDRKGVVERASRLANALIGYENFLSKDTCVIPTRNDQTRPPAFEQNAVQNSVSTTERSSSMGRPTMTRSAARASVAADFATSLAVASIV